jgi:serine/threonine protein phosphatase PrpC
LLSENRVEDTDLQRAGLETHYRLKYPLSEYLGKSDYAVRHQFEMIPFLSQIKWIEDDYLLLCTDGLTDMLEKTFLLMKN